MKKALKVISISVMLTLIIPIPVLAGTPSPKEEVIYVLADSAGTVENIYVVNIFGSGDITDYGDYTEVKMLNTKDPIKLAERQITFFTAADKAYYQGTMQDTVIPWNISIRYFLGGTEYAPAELAGKSGKLEIRFRVTQNKQCRGSFYDQYALQAAFTLNTDDCTNIDAPAATKANVGKNKQLTYTILPGNGIDTVITADVSDFEMAAVTINGVRLNLNIDIDNAELMEQIAELIDGMVKIDDGAASLDGGTTELKSGSETLLSGTGTVKSGVQSLDDGIVQLQTGITAAQDGLDTLNTQSTTLVTGSAEVKTALLTINDSLSKVSVSATELEQLTAASGEIKQGIAALYDGIGELQNSVGYTPYKDLMALNGLDIEALKAANAQTIADLSAQIGSLQDTLSQIENIPGYEDQVIQLQTQINQLQQIMLLLEGNNAALGGTASYLNGLAEAVTELSDGAAELVAAYEQFDAAILVLANTLTNTLSDLSLLSSGISTLAAEYTKLDQGIDDYTDGVAQLVGGYAQIVSGVSELARGSKELAGGSTSLYGGAAQFYDGVIELCDGAGELAAGTRTMRAQTADMDAQVETQVDDLLASLQGDESQTVSFVSAKNTHVNAVQFVIKTAAVEKAETKAVSDTVAAPLTFWQKLLRLFGLY